MTIDPAVWLNGVGLTLGMAGTALIFFFGVPRQTDTKGQNYLLLSGDQASDSDEMLRIRSFKRLGNLGFGLVFLAFLLQLLGLVATL